MNTPAPDTPTIRAGIALYSGLVFDADLHVHESGDMEGQIDEERLVSLINGLQRLAGDPLPVRATYLEPADREWQFAIMDIDTDDSIGILTIHAGAGA